MRAGGGARRRPSRPWVSTCPRTGLVLLPRTIVVTLIVGVARHRRLGAPAGPALGPRPARGGHAGHRARVDQCHARPGRSAASCSWSSAVALILVGLFAGTPLALGPGVLLLFIGLFVLGPLIARPVAKALGRPIARDQGHDRHDGQGERGPQPEAHRPHRGRAGRRRRAGHRRVGARLVDLATRSARSSAKQFHGDFVISVDNFGFGGLSPKLADDLNKLPEVGTAAGIGVNYANVNGKGKTVTVVDPTTAGAVFDLDFIEGQAHRPHGRRRAAQQEQGRQGRPEAWARRSSSRSRRHHQDPDRARASTRRTTWPAASPSTAPSSPAPAWTSTTSGCSSTKAARRERQPTRRRPSRRWPRTTRTASCRAGPTTSTRRRKGIHSRQHDLPAAGPVGHHRDRRHRHHARAQRVRTPARARAGARRRA